MKKTILMTLAAAIVATTVQAQTPKKDREWATRIPCELQTATGRSLKDLIWLQGTTPLLSLDQYRSGKAVDAEDTVKAVVRFAPTPDATHWVGITNYATIANAYLVQMPTIGTNTPPNKPWFYTALFFRGGQLYWTGSGRLHIEATTATGRDGLEWQDISSFGGVTAQELQQALEPVQAHLTNTAIHLTPEQAERIANAITSAPPQTVTSVNSKTGAVVITAADVGALPITGGTIEGHEKSIEFQNDDTEMVLKSTGITGNDDDTGDNFELNSGGLRFEDFMGTSTKYLLGKIMYNGSSFYLPDVAIGNYTIATTSDLDGYLPLAGGEMDEGAIISLRRGNMQVDVTGEAIAVGDGVNTATGLEVDNVAIVSEGKSTRIRIDKIQTHHGTLTFPEKSGTFATTDDIPPPPELPEGILTQEEATNIVKAVTATVWQTVTNTAATVTLTADRDNPIRWVGAGNPTLTLTGLVEGVPIYLTVSGMDSLTINNAYYVGGGMYQTNRVNHYLVWSYGGELLVTPITTTTEAGQ